MAGALHDTKTEEERECQEDVADGDCGRENYISHLVEIGGNVDISI